MQKFVGGWFPQKTSGAALGRPHSLECVVKPWQTSCGGRTLFSSDARYAAQAVTVDDTKCQKSAQNWDGRLLVRILWLWHLMLRHLGHVVLLEEVWKLVWRWRVLVHCAAVHFFHGCIRAELWGGVAAVMPEERASDVERFGEGKDFGLLGG